MIRFRMYSPQATRPAKNAYPPKCHIQIYVQLNLLVDVAVAASPSARSSLLIDVMPRRDLTTANTQSSHSRPLEQSHLNDLIAHNKARLGIVY